MNLITVEKKGLLEDFRDWGVNPDYAEFFISKCDAEGKTVALRSFVFNDTIHPDDKIQWLLVSSAFWCRVFRDAETHTQQTEALSATHVDLGVRTTTEGAHGHNVGIGGAGAHSHTVDIGAHNHSVVMGAHSHKITVAASGSVENTIKNIAMNYIVRLG